jgi:hypothetical protein
LQLHGCKFMTWPLRLETSLTDQAPRLGNHFWSSLVDSPKRSPVAQVLPQPPPAQQQQQQQHSLQETGAVASGDGAVEPPLVVEGIGDAFTSGQLRDYFRERYPSVLSASMAVAKVGRAVQPLGYGTVRFASLAEQQRALVEMDGHVLPGKLSDRLTGALQWLGHVTACCTRFLLAVHPYSAVIEVFLQAWPACRWSQDQDRHLAWSRGEAAPAHRPTS